MPHSYGEQSSSIAVVENIDSRASIHGDDLQDVVVYRSDNDGSHSNAGRDESKGQRHDLHGRNGQCSGQNGGVGLKKTERCVIARNLESLGI